MDAFFYFKRIVGALAQPLTIFTLLVVLSVVLLFFGRKRAALGGLLAGAVLILVCGHPLVTSRVARLLERQYPPLAGPELRDAPPDVIAVLGSGVNHPGDPNLPALSRLGDTARARLLEGMRLARLYPEAQFFTSGYGVESCAAATAEAAMELGMAPERIQRFPDTVDTEDEARQIGAAAGEGARVVVVTSAMHMPRSMRFFRERGIDAVAAPCDYAAPVSDELMNYFGPRVWLPMARRLSEQEGIWHEVLGLIYQEYFRGIRKK